MGDVLVSVAALVCCVFGASAVSKLRARTAYVSYRDGLGETGLLSRRALPAAAAVLASGEVVVAVLAGAGAIMIIAGAAGAVLLTEAVLVLAAIVTVILAAGVWVVVRRGVSAKCACFGSRSQAPLGRVHLIRNLSLLIAVLAGLAAGPLAHRPALAVALIAAVVGVVIALLLIRSEDLAALFAPLS
jgi:hypothetical protein